MTALLRHIRRFIRIYINELFKPNPERDIDPQQGKSHHRETPRLYAVDLTGLVQDSKCGRLIRRASNSEKAKEVCDKREMCLAPYEVLITG
jgi:hypothetical protein